MPPEHLILLAAPHFLFHLLINFTNTKTYSAYDSVVCFNDIPNPGPGETHHLISSMGV